MRSMILAGLIATALHGQTFYNGARGPARTQVDSYVQQSSAVVIPKLFTDHYLFAVPFGVSAGGVQNKGFNFGYILEHRRTNAIIAAGVFRDGEGKYSVVNPQLYTTTELGRSTIDGQFELPFNARTNAHGGLAALTYGYGVGRARVGVSVIKERDKELTGKAIVRLELKKNHQYWFEAHLGRSVQFRFVINR